MAPPIPRTRQPAVGRGRSAGDVLAGLFAVVVLIALTVGVPFGLIRIFGVPIPHGMPTMAVLTHQLDVFAILKVLSVLVWLAWLQLVCCVIAEIRAAVRNTGMPAQVPLAGGTQAVVHRLVTAALLLFTAATALSPAFVHHAPGAPHAISAAAGRGSSAGGQQAIRDARPPQMVGQPEVAQQPQVEKIYVVKPPAGRYHESLWEIAQNHLGDGRRYREIFELNSGRIQPDGTKLTIASLIRPGWVLRMPRDAHGPGIEVVATQSAAPLPAGHEDASGDGAAPGRGVGTGNGAAAAQAAPGTATGGAAQATPGPVAGNGVAAQAAGGNGATAQAPSAGGASAQAASGAGAHGGAARPPGTGSPVSAAASAYDR